MKTYLEKMKAIDWYFGIDSTSKVIVDAMIKDLQTLSTMDCFEAVAVVHSLILESEKVKK